MDVSARRFIWDLLIKEKQNRVILLSTHFMEEADVYKQSSFRFKKTKLVHLIGFREQDCRYGRGTTEML